MSTSKITPSTAPRFALRSTATLLTTAVFLLLAGQAPALARPVPLDDGGSGSSGAGGTGAGGGSFDWTPLLMGVAVVLVIAIAAEVGVLRRRHRSAHA
jgi:hypothetical protein